MVSTSAKYKRILGKQHDTDTFLKIYGGKKTSTYDKTQLKSVVTRHTAFSGTNPQAGCCISGTIQCSIKDPDTDIPEKAKMELSVSITDGVETSEQIPQGTYFIDTRKKTNLYGIGWVEITGYDAMIFAEADLAEKLAEQGLALPLTHRALVSAIAAAIGVNVEASTLSKLSGTKKIEALEDKYTCREVLGFIGALYGSNFVISKSNELRMISVTGPA